MAPQLKKFLFIVTSIVYGLDSLFQKTTILNSWLSKNELFIQEMDLKIQLLSGGLKSSNSKPSCWVSALSAFWEMNTGTRHFSGHWFFQFQRNLPITSKIVSISKKLQNKSCTSSKDAINGALRKIQSPYLTIYEFSNMMIKNTSHDTITDSSLWAFLHGNGWFFVKNEWCS